MDWKIGIDEVGRGCLAGHVSVGAVMVQVDAKPIPGVDDSKKLSPKKRESVHRTILETPSVFVAVTSAPVEVIDRVGIDKAVLACFERAARRLLAIAEEKGLGPVVSIKIDGRAPNAPFMPGFPIEFVINGDATDWLIGAASIVAKVTRDRQMVELAKEFPGYGWEHNAGYGTAVHEAAIRTLGLTAMHRTKFCRKFATPINPMIPKEDPGIFDLFE